jgi:C-terminal processing protease CtpA/Prc
LEKSKRATLIRERTKGYFLAGKLFKIIPGKYDLYLAVKKGSGPDLEGKGVKPDIEVPQNLE